MHNVTGMIGIVVRNPYAAASLTEIDMPQTPDIFVPLGKNIIMGNMGKSSGEMLQEMQNIENYADKMLKVIRKMYSNVPSMELIVTDAFFESRNVKNRVDHLNACRKSNGKFDRVHIPHEYYEDLMYSLIMGTESIWVIALDALLKYNPSDNTEIDTIIEPY
jgi:hypothetical protein